MNFSDKALIVMLVILIAFICAMIVIFEQFQQVPDSLVYGVLGLFGAECGILGAIKNIKTKKEIALLQQEDQEGEEM